MRAGQLRHKITIQEKTTTPDGMGGHTEAWGAFDEVWAAIWPVSAKERVQSQQLEGQITHKIRIRYLAGVTSAMRVLFGSRVFELVAPPINMDERNIQMDLLCEEVEA